MNTKKEFRTCTNQASYSPQDHPIQAPTRAFEAPSATAGVEDGGFIDDPTLHDRRGSVDGPTMGGGGAYSVSETIERRWRGKDPVVTKEERPSIEPERIQSWMDRLEEAGKDAIRRSSTTTDVVIDKVADKLNSLGTSIERAVKPGERRASWSQKAFSLFFPQESKNNTSPSNPTTANEPKRPSLSERALSFFHNEVSSPTSKQAANRHRRRRRHTYSEQRDVEYFGSDDRYDAIQASFCLVSESTVTRDSSEPLQKQHHLRSQSQQETTEHIGTKHQRNTIQEPNDPTHWFDADPESGRVKVPPLSNNPSGTSAGSDTTATTRLLYDSTSATDTFTIGDHPANTLDPNLPEQQNRRFHVVESKKAPQHPDVSDPENIMDSDFENWKPHSAID